MPTYPTIDCDPDWSPDGSTIVFHHLHYDSAGKVVPDSSGLWFISPVGSNKRMCLGQPGFTRARWSPDGQWLLFSRDRQIWKVKVTGDSMVRILSDSGGDNGSPTWSPDGKRMAFDRFQEDGRTGIWTMAADGTDLRYVGCGCMPDWSPDGGRIAYTVLDYLGVKDTSGGNDRKLVTTDAGTGAPAVSPDGSEIVFAAAINRKEGLYRVDISGRRLRALAWDAACPSWSPDGTRIVFVGFDHAGLHPDGFLYVMNADGSGRRQLTFGPEP